MNRFFADAHFFFVILNPKDSAHPKAMDFVVMTEEGITEALTADHHFEQAGFTALLK